MTRNGRETATDRAAWRGVLVAGGCHIDILGRTTGRYEPATSCPGEVMRRPGGVGRNVAVLLGRAGVRVVFASRVGDDDEGRLLLEGLNAAEVDTTCVAVEAGSRTGCYLAIHDERGELVSAVSDLGVYDGFVVPPGFRRPSEPALPEEEGGCLPLVFADANLPIEALLTLAADHGNRLAVDGISRAKAPKLRHLVGSGATLVVNLPSAGALCRREFATPADAAAALSDIGAGSALVTGGAMPLAVLADGGIVERRPQPAAIADVTGTGDAQIAGFLLARTAGAGIVAAVETGMLAAGAALGTHGALAELPPAVIAAARAAGEPPD